MKYCKSIILIFLIYALSGCSEDKSVTTYTELMNHANSVKIINTHEHQRWPADLEYNNYNFWTLLRKAYLNADLVSAGGNWLTANDINHKSLDELWEINHKWLEYSSQTSYYKHFITGLNLCYNRSDKITTKENIENLSKQIEEKYANYEAWLDECFQRFNFETFFLDQYWNNHNSNINKNYFSFVLQTNTLTGNISSAKIIYTDQNQEIQKLKSSSGINTVKKLEDYLHFAEALIRDARDKGAVALKNSQAYWRTIEYENITKQRAEELFNKAPEISQKQENELQDFMFHWILKKAAELDLPVQIHTGYLAGNGNNLENGKPIKLNNLFLQHPKTKFDLFHGGFPWTGEWIALGKMFPNVYLNLVWLPQISKQRAITTFHELLDCVPYNKILWGGDCHLIEETVGSLQYGKEVVCIVLAQKVDNGEMELSQAKEIISAVFYDNAKSLFKLH